MVTKELDPQISALLEIAADSGAPELYTLPPEQARAQYLLNVKKLAGSSPEIGGSYDRNINGPGGGIPVRVYKPKTLPGHKLPVLVYFHGGGWSIGSIESHDHVCRWLCSNSDCLIVSVEYRMGPEHKFPAAVEDAMTATRWVMENAGKMSADADSIGVGGDSAGANLATVVSIMMRSENVSAIKTQLLIYPATDMTMSHESHRLFGDGYRLTRPLMVWSVANYLRKGEDMFDYRASPLMADDHADLPPALIITAGYDPLRDEGKAYADKLRNSGVPVKYVCYDGMIHGFIGMPGKVDMSKEALLEASAYLKEKLY